MSDSLPVPAIPNNNNLDKPVSRISSLIHNIRNIGVLGSTALSTKQSGPSALVNEKETELRREEDKDRNKIIKLLEEIANKITPISKGFSGENTGGGGGLLGGLLGTLLTSAAGGSLATLGTMAALRRFSRSNTNVASGTTTPRSSLVRRVANQFNPRPTTIPSPPKPQVAQIGPDGIRRIQLRPGGPLVDFRQVQSHAEFANMDDELARTQGLLRERAAARARLAASRPTSTPSPTKPASTPPPAKPASTPPAAKPTTTTPAAKPATPSTTSTGASGAGSGAASSASRSAVSMGDRLLGQSINRAPERLVSSIASRFSPGVQTAAGGVARSLGAATGLGFTAWDVYNIENNPLYEKQDLSSARRKQLENGEVERDEFDDEIEQLEGRMEELKRRQQAISIATGVTATTVGATGVGLPVAAAVGALGSAASAVSEASAELEKSIEIPERLVEIGNIRASRNANKKISANQGIKELETADTSIGQSGENQGKAITLLQTFGSFIKETQGKITSEQDRQIFIQKLKELDLWNKYEQLMRSDGKDPISDAPEGMKDIARLLYGISGTNEKITIKQKNLLQAASALWGQSGDIFSFSQKGQLESALKIYGGALPEPEPIKAESSESGIEIPQQNNNTSSTQQTQEISNLNEFNQSIQFFTQIMYVIGEKLSNIFKNNNNSNQISMKTNANQPSGPGLSGDSAATQVVQMATERQIANSTPS